MLAACLKYYNEKLRFQERVRRCYAAILNRAMQLKAAGNKDLAERCKSLKFDCFCCSDIKLSPMVAAYYDRNRAFVVMCAGHPDIAAQTTSSSADMCHEMVHVLQGPSCNPSPWARSSSTRWLRKCKRTTALGNAQARGGAWNSPSALFGWQGIAKRTSQHGRKIRECPEVGCHAIQSGSLCADGINPGMF